MEQQTIHIVARFSNQEDGKARLDLASLGDLSPEGYRLGATPTGGPNYHTAVVLDGHFPPGKLPQDFVTNVGIAVRKILHHAMLLQVVE